MTHAIIYDRASTNHQKDNFSRVNAREVGIRIAEQHGFEWEYVKEVGSGTTLTGRPKMMRILDRIAAGEIQVIIVQELDRLARPEEALVYNTVRQTVMEYNVIIYTHTSRIDLNNDSDDFVADINMAVAKKERKTILRRSLRGMTARAESGKFLGSPGLGYTWGGDDLVIEETEAETVRAIFTILERKGGNLHQTAKYLNQKGYTGKRGGKFGHNSVLQAASRKMYIGVLDISLTDKITHRPDLQIISVVQFERVQKLIEARKGGQRGGGQRGRYPLTGFLVCGNCGGGVVAKNNGKTVFYQCKDSRYAHATCKSGKAYSEHLVLPAIIDFLADLIQTDFHTALDNAAAKYGKGVTEEAIEAAIQGELASVQAGKQRIVEAISLGTLTNEEAASKLAELREQEQRLTVELASIAEKTAMLEEWQKAVETLKGKGVSGELHRLAKNRPVVFRQIMSLAFEPNSLKVRTEYVKGKGWVGALEDHQLTEAMQEVANTVPFGKEGEVMIQSLAQKGKFSSAILMTGQR